MLRARDATSHQSLHEWVTARIWCVLTFGSRARHRRLTGARARIRTFVLVLVAALRVRHRDHLGAMTRNDPSPIVRTGVVSPGRSTLRRTSQNRPVGRLVRGPGVPAMSIADR